MEKINRRSRTESLNQMTIAVKLKNKDAEKMENIDEILQKTCREINRLLEKDFQFELEIKGIGR